MANDALDRIVKDECTAVMRGTLVQAAIRQAAYEAYELGKGEKFKGKQLRDGVMVPAADLEKR